MRTCVDVAMATSCRRHGWATSCHVDVAMGVDMARVGRRPEAWALWPGRGADRAGRAELGRESDYSSTFGRPPRRY